MNATRKLSVCLLLAVALLAAGSIWGLSASFAESSPPASTGKVVLRLGVPIDADSLNVLVGYMGVSYEVWSLNYDFLVNHDPEGNPAPGLAESWSTSPDGLTWTFKIRRGAKWQDGVPVTAKDVAYTYNLVIQKKIDTYTLYMKNIEEAVAVDDSTVEIRCSKPKANMLSLWIYILPEHIWSKIDKPMKYQVTYPMIGSGPFQCVEWKRGSYIKMVKVPGYWGGEPTVDEILFQIYTNTDTMTQDLKIGTLDGAYDVPPAQFAALSRTEGVQGSKMNLFACEYLSFNCYSESTSLGHPALKDIDFRRALNWAVDKQRLVDVGLAGYGRPGTTICPPDEWPPGRDPHYEPTAEEAYGFDIAKANQLLDEAGYTDSDGDGIREYKGKDIKLRLWSRSESAASQKEAKLIVGWFRQCGLAIDYSVVDDGTLNDAIYNYDKAGAYAPDYDMYLWDWWGYIDAGDTLACFTTSQIEWWNDCCWSNAEFDELSDQQYGEMDVQTRMDMLKRMQQLMYGESPYIVLTYPDALQVNNTSRWEGWVPFMGSGLPWYSSLNMDSYLKLKPVAGVESRSGGTNSTTWIIIGVVAALLAIVVIVLLSRRGKGMAVEE